jgi:hypothetical protein
MSFQSYSTHPLSFDKGRNLFDFYTENEFLPELAIDGSTLGITYEMQYGYLTCLGNMAMFNLGLKLTDMGSEQGDLTILNLPHPSANLYYVACSAFSQMNLKNKYYWVSGRMDAQSNVMHLLQSGDNKDLLPLDDKDINNQTAIYVSGAYSI